MWTLSSDVVFLRGYLLPDWVSIWSTLCFNARDPTVLGEMMKTSNEQEYFSHWAFRPKDRTLAGFASIGLLSHACRVIGHGVSFIRTTCHLSISIPVKLSSFNHHHLLSSELRERLSSRSFDTRVSQQNCQKSFCHFRYLVSFRRLGIVELAFRGFTRLLGRWEHEFFVTPRQTSLHFDRCRWWLSCPTLCPAIEAPSHVLQLASAETPNQSFAQCF